MADYINRDKINEAFDSIWDCADMVFEPDDHCCATDDCGHCKWLQTKNAIKKKLDHIPAADVRPVVHGEQIDRKPKTHGDELRTMTNEEMAEWIAGDVLNLTGGSLKMATEAWLDWLKQEVTDNDKLLLAASE